MIQEAEPEIKGLMLTRRSANGGRYVANWRVNKPVFDYEKCVRCGQCADYCPEAAIFLDEDQKPEIDMRFCKGCGVCANECPVKAIEMVKEA